jgi:hypothetical protein
VNETLKCLSSGKWWLRTAERIFAFIGIIIVFVMVAHESMHKWVNDRYGISTTDICFIGWNYNLSTIAWTDSTYRPSAMNSTTLEQWQSAQDWIDGVR